MSPCWDVIFAVVFLVIPHPTWSFSITTTDIPCSCNMYAVKMPASPAPITATSVLISPFSELEGAIFLSAALSSSSLENFGSFSSFS